jgi:hypothetical protein
MLGERASWAAAIKIGDQLLNGRLRLPKLQLLRHHRSGTRSPAGPAERHLDRHAWLVETDREGDPGGEQ